MKIKEKLLTVGTSLGLGIMTLSNTVFADIVSEVSGGGEIQSSKIGTGMLKLVRDLTGTLQWIIPFVGVGFILWQIPFTRKYLISLYEENPIVNLIINFILNIFK